MSKFSLALLIHAHQPVGNFDHVMEETYRQCYAPFVECLSRHPNVRVGLHYSGVLLEWLGKYHPEYVDQIDALAVRGQVEVVGGGFYEPILIMIPPEDQFDQIRRLSDFLADRFGKRPKGAWLAERVWEPQLPAVLAEAGVEYTLVDDSHFLAAGKDPEELYGYYIAEDRGRTVKVIPGLTRLRYLIPFGTVEDSIHFLRGAANEHPGTMASMGDDMEKFGGWPHTYEHCYRDGWLDRFFGALEASRDWLESVPPGEALAARKSLGRADLPTASYPEMMEWALPTRARQQFHSLREEFAQRPDVRRFMIGGFWRGFFSKYDEANLLQKKMLRVSSKLRFKSTIDVTQNADRAQALTHLLRAQCNDAYWHGVFGGLYAPHLRMALWRELITAETFTDASRHTKAKYQDAEQFDFDGDGLEEIEVTSPKFAALIKPSGGGTLEVLDFRPSAVTLIGSLQRRPEAYHANLGDLPKLDGSVTSIHDHKAPAEAGLEQRLRYDTWPRHAFRLLLFQNGKTHADYDALRLQESAAFAGGDYKVIRVAPGKSAIALESTLDQAISGTTSNIKIGVEKTFQFDWDNKGCDVTCRIELVTPDADAPPAASAAVRCMVGLEVVINLLAPNAPDRFFEFSGNRQPLAWSGCVDGCQLRVVDEWQDVAVAIGAAGAKQIWVAPIETISESEKGFERVYQGSQILAVWPAEIAIGSKWSAEMSLRVTPARPGPEQ